MKFATTIASALLVASAAAKDVACRVGGVQQSVVDYDTGVCNFPIPDEYPVQFRFTALDDYLVDAYYAIFTGLRYFNDIRDAGRIISIPAKSLYDLAGPIPLYHIHAEASPSSNSTASFRKRFSSQLAVRDTEDDFIASIEAMTGTALPGSLADFSVTDPDVSSSSTGTGAGSTGSATTGAGSTDTGAVTVTNTESTLITITSCSDNKCHESTVPATLGPVTTTVNGETTVYTTWCPVSEAAEATVTNLETTIITITSCKDNKCHETLAPATQGPTTVTVENEVTVYTTWCPITAETKTVPVAYTTVVCHEDVCETAVATSTVVTTNAAPVVTSTEVVYTTIVCEEEKCKTQYSTTQTAVVVTVTSTVGTGTVAAESTPAAPAEGAETTKAAAPPAAGVTTVASQSAPGSAAPAVTTNFNGAGKVGSSVVAVLAVAFAYLL